MHYLLSGFQRLAGNTRRDRKLSAYLPESRGKCPAEGLSLSHSANFFLNPEKKLLPLHPPSI
jgi:hypothetical protein